MTSDKADQGDEKDDLTNDIPSENPGTETSEVPRVSGFHMVAEPASPLLPPPTTRSDDHRSHQSTSSRWASTSLQLTS